MPWYAHDELSLPVRHPHLDARSLSTTVEGGVLDQVEHEVLEQGAIPAAEHQLIGLDA